MAELTTSPRRTASETHGAPPALTDQFRAAVRPTQGIHGHQRRPGTEPPYLAHLLVVTGLVLEDGGDGDEDQAIAAMLHDSVEDGGGRPMLERTATTFGARVAAIVAGCSDTVNGHPTGRWIERKRRYLRPLETVDDDAILRVALADRVHNAARSPGTAVENGMRCAPVALAGWSTTHPVVPMRWSSAGTTMLIEPAR